MIFWYNAKIRISNYYNVRPIDMHIYAIYVTQRGSLEYVFLEDAELLKQVWNLVLSFRLNPITFNSFMTEAVII